MAELSSRRIILLGKTGAGKSSLANTIFGEQLFHINHSPNSGTAQCQAKTKSVNGRSLTLIDTPGFFDTDKSEEEMKPEIVRCITECAPGPHAFLIVLKVDRFTEQEQAVITKIRQCFSEEALKYAVLVFTHGDQLPDGKKIAEFVGENKNMSDLLEKCGGWCHVVDNKYWKNNEDDYRCNQFQVEELFRTLDKLTEANQGGCYTNEMLQAVRREIQKEQELIRRSPGNMSRQEIGNKAKKNVSDSLMIRSAGFATGALLGALLGVAEMITEDVFQNPSQFLSGEAAKSTAFDRALKGAWTGCEAAEEAQTPMEAVQKAAQAVWSQSGFAEIKKKQ